LRKLPWRNIIVLSFYIKWMIRILFEPVQNIWMKFYRILYLISLFPLNRYQFRFYKLYELGHASSSRTTYFHVFIIFGLYLMLKINLVPDLYHFRLVKRFIELEIFQYFYYRLFLKIMLWMWNVSEMNN